MRVILVPFTYSLLWAFQPVYLKHSQNQHWIRIKHCVCMGIVDTQKCKSPATTSLAARDFVCRFGVDESVWTRMS